MTAVPTSGEGPALERVKQVFRFLKAFAERNVPLQRRLADQPWTFRLADLPEHPAVQIGEVHLAKPGDSTVGGDEAGESAPLLRVRRPALTRAPSPPGSLVEWLQPGWESPDNQIQLVRERNVVRGNETVTVAFTDDPARTQALQQWRGKWEVWATAEQPARAAMRAFERLFELRGRIALESERVELMLGDGRLTWQTSEGEVDHPILLQRVELEFDADVPEIRVVDADRAPELYGALLSGGDRLSAETLNALRKELEVAGFHPLAQEATSAYLRRLVQLLSPRGTFRGEPRPTSAGSDPAIIRDPVLLLRTRQSGFPAAFDRVLEDLEHQGSLAVSLTRLVGVTPVVEVPELPTPRSPWGEPPDVLLSKPANPEQIEIARALERHQAVLVQGPPGTGKSHTIANLIGHLVAHGKRVLVTSHTTKALRVLRAHLVDTLLPLCVAVLENDLEARTQMEQSVRGILSRLTTDTEGKLENDVATLAESRAVLNSDIDRISEDLRIVREAEYVPILVAGESVAPSDAARWVTANEEGNTWIPGPLEAGAPLPLKVEEVAELYSLSARVTQIEEGELEAGLPDTAKVPSSEGFAETVAMLDHSEALDFARFWSRPPSEPDLEIVEHLFAQVSTTARDLASLQPWQRHVVRAGYNGGSERDLWLGLRDAVFEAAARWEKVRPQLLEYEPENRSALPHDEVRRLVGEILAHMEGGGALSSITLLLHGKWKGVIQAMRVNGQRPSATSHFRALGMRLTLDEGRRKLNHRWSRQAESIGLPGFSACGPVPEPALKDYASQFEQLTVWWRDRWAPTAQALRDAGFKWEDFRKQEVAKSGPAAPFDRDVSILERSLLDAVTRRLAAIRRDRAMRQLQELEECVEPHRGPVCALLLRAIHVRDVSGYEVARKALLDLAAKRATWRWRKDLIGRVAVSAPGWAREIRGREGRHASPGVPGDVRIAWRWRQLKEEIDRRAALDEGQLTQSLYRRQTELRQTTAELIDRRAWLGQLRRTDLQARQALQGWADTQKRIGKGTGKRVPELQARARELLVKAREAVPVWIMPLARVAESFDPRVARFDVVIVDEASQSDVTGLLAWYLGDRVVVVGDHEQVSPLAVGQLTEPIVALIAQHLGGIPNSHLYDGNTSIYHLARTCFGGTIALREHFRCVPDIIDFSNHLSYDGEIRPLRDPATTHRPHAVEYVVTGMVAEGRSGKINTAEARTVAALVKAVSELPEYREKTLGAISLLGDEQAGLIQDLTVSLVGAVVLDQRRFVAGNAAQFQGDERHVMFLSMVDAPVGGTLPLKQTELFKQRYNVAASRARDQLWVIHSLNPDRDLRSGDLRRTLIEHVRDPGARRKAMERAKRRAESPFEAAVIERLIGSGYRVEPQVWVGQYRIDMVVSDGVHQVALECDGDRFHSADQIPADMVRQAVLERAGWRFIRVRGTRFFRNKEGTTEWILQELQRLGVQPVGPAPTEQTSDDGSAAHRERVVRRAHEIMREQGWLQESQPVSVEPTTN